MVEIRTSKKSGTGSTPPTGDYKLTSPRHLTDSPCSVAKTSHKRVIDAGGKLGVKKAKKTTTSSEKLTPEAEPVKAATSSQLQEGEYIIPQNLWKHLQVNKIGPSTQIIEDVRKHLDAEQLQCFKEYSVGHLIDVDTANFGFCHLNSFFCAQYAEFKRLKKAGERWKDIRVIQFLHGGLRHGIRCHDVDTVYMPINQPNEHWFLAAVKLNEWFIHIIDSLYTARRKQARMDIVRPLAEMLPDALADVGFFDVRDEMKQYKGSPFSLKYERKYPQQDGTDCGLFVVKFIEFLMTKGLDIRDCVQEKMDAFRYQSCVQLFTHGCRKRADIYRSDDE